MILTVQIPTPSLQDEAAFIRSELEKIEPPVYMPSLYLYFTVEIVRAVRAAHCFDLGHAASLDAALLSRKAAVDRNRTIVSFTDVKDGIYAGVGANAFSADRALVGRCIDKTFFDIACYMQQHIPAADLEAVAQYCRHAIGDTERWDAGLLRKAVTGDISHDVSEDFVRLAGWISQHETIHKYRLYEVMAEYLRVYDYNRTQKQLQEEPSQ